jgi:hypothetical protein
MAPEGFLYLSSSILGEPQILGASVQEFAHPWLLCVLWRVLTYVRGVF